MKRLSQQKIPNVSSKDFGTEAITLITLYLYFGLRNPILFPGGFIQPLFGWGELSGSLLPSLPSHHPPDPKPSPPAHSRRRGLWPQPPGTHCTPWLQHPLHRPGGGTAAWSNCPRVEYKKNPTKTKQTKPKKPPTSTHKANLCPDWRSGFQSQSRKAVGK